MKLLGDQIKLVDVVVIVLVPFIALVMFFGVVWMDSRRSQENRYLSCQLIGSNIQQLTILREIALDLGLPVNFEIPRRPAECAEFLSP